MKNQDKLTHTEIMDGLTHCFRELLTTEVSHRNMPNIINRAKATAAIVTAAHREEIMEAKRQSGQSMVMSNAKTETKKLKKL